MLAALLVVDKPAGPTSFDVIRQVRKATGVRKAGHGGTLDPFATGVLVVGLGAATRLLRFLSDGDKVYRMVVRFGAGTDSHDATGHVVATGDVTFGPSELERAIADWIGTVEQRPPSLSALRVDGERAYARHRRGETEDLPARPVRIDTIEVLGVTLPDVELRVRCGGGTYMRALARDLGHALGCPAHAASLRREAVGPFDLEDAVSVDRLSDWSEHALPPRQVARAWPTVRLTADAVALTRQGQQPAPELGEATWPPETLVALVDDADELVAVAKPDHGQLKLVMVLPESAHADS